jgi:hypothetical protein
MADADLTMKRNDTWPPLRAQLKDGDGEPLDLSTADTVRILLEGEETKLKIKAGPAAIVGAPEDGEVEYEWQGPEGEDPADLHTADRYKGEFEITDEDGSVYTVPNDGYFTLLVVEDLG